MQRDELGAGLGSLAAAKPLTTRHMQFRFFVSGPVTSSLDVRPPVFGLTRELRLDPKDATAATGASAVDEPDSATDFIVHHNATGRRAAIYASSASRSSRVIAAAPPASTSAASASARFLSCSSRMRSSTVSRATMR